MSNSDQDAATREMIAHLSGIAERVAGASGDIEAIRRIIEDYSRLDAATRRMEARAIAVRDPAGEWVLAEGSDPHRRLLYLHGGSWMSGSLDGYRPLAARISEAAGCAVFVADYRLTPENAFPRGLEDCVRAFRWLRENGPDGPCPARECFIAGDSAGGNLALAACLKLADEGGPLPDAVVALSPATDLTWSAPSLASHAAMDPILRPERLGLVSEAYVQGGERMDHPYVSPLFGDFAGLRRMLIQVGDREVLLDDARRLADAVKRQGVDVELEIYPEMPHVFQLFAPTVRAATEAIRRIGEFLRAGSRK